MMKSKIQERPRLKVSIRYACNFLHIFVAIIRVFTILNRVVFEFGNELGKKPFERLHSNPVITLILLIINIE